MTSKISASSSEKVCKQNKYLFNIDNERQIQISSNFQNGNICLVKQIHELYYILESVADIQNQQSKKSWFYFRMRSIKGIKVRIIIQNVSIYENIFQQKYHCKPFIKQGQYGKWQQLNQSFLTFRDQIVLVIDHTFKNTEYIYICLTIPFTYRDNQQYLLKIKDNIHPFIHYTDDILCHTQQNRPVHLLTITQKSSKFKIKRYETELKKPIIMITSRVHPGQVSSSFVLQGVLEFLLNYNNFQAFILRKLFTFKIIPMLNPDGVAEGNYRMDPQGFNLNRFYQNPILDQHPTIFHAAQLMKKLAQGSKIQFYFDLHSHSSIKQSFIYGNALEDIVSQAYSQLYCKILQQNYPRFRLSLSNFGQKQMKHKDKGELLSKQGCGRVVINRLYGVIQSYTVQSSVFPSSYNYFSSKNCKNQQKNQNFIYESQQNQQIYSYQQAIWDIDQNIIIRDNKLLGRSLLISILDMVKKNPYTRLSEDFNQNFLKDHSIRLFQTQERFKLMDMKAYQKCRMINQFVKLNNQDSLDRLWNICGVYLQINQINWPKQFKKIIVYEDLINKQQKSIQKGKRIKTQIRQKIISKSLNKPQKHIKLKTEMKNQQSHRSSSPKQEDQHVNLFPQIKYSIELKSDKIKQSLQLKTATVKQMQLDISSGNNQIIEGDRVKKRMIIDYIQQQISKINPDKQIFKRSNASLNRLIANKIIQRQRVKNRNSQMNDYQRIILESRKRIATQCKQGIQEAIQIKAIKDRMSQQGEQQMKGLEHKKAEMVKKRFMAANKAIQLIKRNDKIKIKLPDLNKLSLIVQNSNKKQRQRPAFLDETFIRSHFDNSGSE